MLLDPTLTATYTVLAAALAFSPGPDTMFVLATGMRYRAKGAIASAFGIGAGALVHAVLAAAGVSAVIAASPVAFEAMKILGALYLAWLGVQAIRSCLKNSGATKLGATIEAASPGRLFLRGFLTNLLNPKVIVFYLALLPQFASVELGHVGLQIFLLGCIHNAIGVTFLIVVGVAAGKAAGWLATTSFGRWLDGIAGVFFLGLAARLALTGRAGG
jgi:threonine/homoserine/homoserine lactone efflux protein